MPHPSSRLNPDEGKGYDCLLTAAACYKAARQFEMYPSLDEKDKLVDELLTRRLRAMALKRYEEGLKYLKKALGDIADE